MKNYPEWLFSLENIYFNLRSLWPFTGFPYHSNENYKPFFIVGSGRSGNTLVRRILCNHEHIHIPPETYVLGRVIRLFDRYRGHKWIDLVNLILSTFEYHKEFRHFDLSLRPVAQKLYTLPSSQRSLAIILASIYDQYCLKQGKTGALWGDKTPINVFCLPLIKRVFPDSKFINLIRDGRDVVASFKRTGLLNNIEEAAHTWTRSIEYAHRFKRRHPSSILEIVYEELVSRPKLEVEKICAFLQVDYSDKLLLLEKDLHMGDVENLKHHEAVMTPISTKSIGRYKIDLTNPEIKKVEAIQQRLLSRLGYIRNS